MKFGVTASNPSDPEDLRALLIEAAEQLSGPGASVLEASMSCDGHPILLQDADYHPVVVSFDLEHGEKALIEGLRAVELLTTALPCLNQVYAELQEKQRPAKLIVVSQKPLPGSAAILAACPGLCLYNFRLLQINNETGLWLDCLSADTASRQSPAEDGPAIQPANDANGLPAMSEEEAAYFQQL